MLTEDAVRASDRRARFVGIAEYEAAGGAVLRDLFEADDGGWLQDPGLLDRLVAEKLEREAEAIRADGWKWVPEFRESTLHVVTGLLLPIWRQLPNDGGRVYRLQADDGERVIGRQVSPAWVAAACATLPELSPEDAMAGLVSGRMVLHLADGMQLRRVRVMHVHRTELIGFTDAMRDRLRSMSLKCHTPARRRPRAAHELQGGTGHAPIPRHTGRDVCGPKTQAQVTPAVRTGS
jgi:hypothetical protein